MPKFLFPVSISTIIIASSTSAFAETPTSSPPSGQESAQSQITKNVQFGDWSLVCRKASASSSQSCELVQSFTLNGQKAPFAQIGIGKPRSDMPQQVSVVVPNNVSFPSSVKIAIDEKDSAPVDVAWARCIPGSCFANALVTSDVQKKWSALETRGRVIFKAANGQDIMIPISFKGLKGAIDALAKEK